MKLVLLATLALSAPLEPRQRLQTPHPRAIPAPVRRARVELQDDGRTVRRVASVVENGTKSPVFDNTCVTGYYAPLSSAAMTGGIQPPALVDQGSIPVTVSAQTSSCAPGTSDCYEITRFEIAYCTTTGQPVTYVASVWSGASPPCPNLFGTASSVSLTLQGLPRSASSTSFACYLVTVDLGTPGFALCGAVAGDPDARFAWAHQVPLTTGMDGPLIAGNPGPGGCAPCVGTAWERPLPTSNPGTGRDTADSFWYEDFGGGNSTCSSFGGVPFGAFHLALSAHKIPGDPVCPSFCDATDGAHALCPGPLPNCIGGGALNPVGGCDIEFPPQPGVRQPGVHLACITQDVSGQSATLMGTGYPPSTSPTALVLRANNQESFPVTFGDGLRCVGLVNLVRFGETFAFGGTSTHVVNHGAGAGTFHYQLWFRNGPVTYCVTTGGSPGVQGRFNLSNGRTLTW